MGESDGRSAKVMRLPASICLRPFHGADPHVHNQFVCSVSRCHTQVLVLAGPAGSEAAHFAYLMTRNFLLRRCLPPPLSSSSDGSCLPLNTMTASPPCLCAILTISASLSLEAGKIRD